MVLLITLNTGYSLKYDLKYGWIIKRELETWSFWLKSEGFIPHMGHPTMKTCTWRLDPKTSSFEDQHGPHPREPARLGQNEKQL